MTEDFRYSMTSVRGAYRYGAALRAVCNPILNAFYRGRRWSDGGMTLENVREALLKVRDVWRQQVAALAAYGCPSVVGETPEKTKKNIHFLRTCPPFGILPYSKGSRACGHRLCPFCYGRRLIRGFKHIEMGAVP